MHMKALNSRTIDMHIYKYMCIYMFQGSGFVAPPPGRVAFRFTSLARPMGQPLGPATWAWPVGVDPLGPPSGPGPAGGQDLATGPPVGL